MPWHASLSCGAEVAQTGDDLGLLFLNAPLRRLHELYARQVVDVRDEFRSASGTSGCTTIVISFMRCCTCIPCARNTRGSSGSGMVCSRERKKYPGWERNSGCVGYHSSFAGYWQSSVKSDALHKPSYLARDLHEAVIVMKADRLL